MNQEIRGKFIETEKMWPEEIVFLDRAALDSKQHVLAFGEIKDGNRQSVALSKRPNLCGPRTADFVARNLLGRLSLRLQDVLSLGEAMQTIGEGGMIMNGLTELLDRLDIGQQMVMLSPKKEYRNFDHIKWLVDRRGVLVVGSWELDQNDIDEHIVTIIGYSQNGEVVIADSSFRGSINPENKDFKNMGFYKMKYEDFVKRWFWSRYGFKIDDGKLLAEGGWDNLPALAVWPKSYYKEI